MVEGKDLSLSTGSRVSVTIPPPALPAARVSMTKVDLGLLWTDKALHVQWVGTRACITFFFRFLHFESIRIN